MPGKKCIYEKSEIKQFDLRKDTYRLKWNIEVVVDIAVSATVIAVDVLEAVAIFSFISVVRRRWSWWCTRWRSFWCGCCCCCCCRYRPRQTRICLPLFKVTQNAATRVPRRSFLSLFVNLWVAAAGGTAAGAGLGERWMLWFAGVQTRTIQRTKTFHLFFPESEEPRCLLPGQKPSSEPGWGGCC